MSYDWDSSALAIEVGEEAFNGGHCLKVLCFPSNSSILEVTRGEKSKQHEDQSYGFGVSGSPSHTPVIRKGQKGTPFVSK